MQPEGSESTWLYEFLAWLEFNRKRVIAGAIGVLVLIAVVQVYVWYRAQAELQANDALISLKSPRGEAADTGPTASELLRVVQEHGSTRAAERALLMAASALYTEGKHADAQKQFELFLSRYGGSPLAGIASLGVATCLDAQDKMDEALAAYQGLLNQYPNDSVVFRARLAMAALYEAKKQPEQAFRIYEEIGRQTGAGMNAMEANRRKEALLQKHPSLGMTNAPARVAATPAPAAMNRPAASGLTTSTNGR